MFVRDFENIDVNASNLILSAFIMADSFFCGIVEKDTNSSPPIYHLKSHYSFVDVDFGDISFIESVKSHKLWENNFNKISLLNFTNKNLTLPLGVDSQVIGAIPMFDFQEVFVEKIINQNLATYFGFSHAQQTAIKSIFEGRDHEVHHLPSVLSAYFVGNYETLYHIHIEDKRCYLYGQVDQKMIFYNTYEMLENTDILYHLLNTMNEMGHAPLETKVTMSGWAEESSPIFTLLKSYVPAIQVIEIGHEAVLDTHAEGYKLHYYFAHFAHALCV